MEAELRTTRKRWLLLAMVIGILALGAAGFSWWGVGGADAAPPASAADILESFEAAEVDPASIPFGTCGEDCKHTGH